MPLSPECLNLLADPLIGSVTFGVVGLYYIRGSYPVLGSFLYMFFYCVHIGLLFLILSCYPTTWLMGAVAVVYFALHILTAVLMRRFGR